MNDILINSSFPYQHFNCNNYTEIFHFIILPFTIKFIPGEFDMRVKSCMASDGAGHIIKLSDEFGCVLRPKMISRFLKARAPDEKATVITYAFFHAFKFPDALSVHIKCKVEICRHGCLDHCQLSGGIHERKDVIEDEANIASSNEINSFLRNEPPVRHNPETHDDLQDLTEAAQTQHEDHEDGEDYYDIIHHSSSQEYQHMGLKRKEPQVLDAVVPPEHVTESRKKSDFEKLMEAEHQHPHQESRPMDHDPMEQATLDEKFPHGPRYFENRVGKPAVAGPRSLDLDSFDVSQGKRKKRSIKVRNARSADVGVTGLYEVISEADLAFSVDQKQESVTVFQVRFSNPDRMTTKLINC